MPAVVAARLPRLGPSRPCAPRGTQRRPVPLITCFAHTASDRHGRYERILRYPDGNVRRIRYPAPTEEDQAGDASGDNWETLNVWKAATGKARQQAAPDRAPAASSVEQQQRRQQEAAPQVDPEAVPDSPLQLLRYLTSDQYKSSQASLWRKVRESYEVLDASPWVAPRPLYVLATQQAGHDAALTYTLRTRVGRPDQEDELTRLLGRTRPDGAPVIACSEVVDGVVAFEGEQAAGQFADMLEEGGGLSEVAVARCDSHALFRSVQDARGVVVLLRPAAADGYLPQPHQLATSLRGQRSLEEGSG